MRSAIYIDRNNLYYYGGNVHAPVAFPFPKTTVFDMEIINEAELATQISEWIKKNKIESSSTIILLSNTVYLQKEIPEGTPPEKQNEIKKAFKENVPFSDTYLQEIPVGKSLLLVAVNTNFVYAIRDIFHSCGFTIDAIAPVAEVYGLQPVTAFNVQVAQEAIKKISKDNGFPLHQIEEVPNPQSEDPLPQTHSNNRLYIMVGVFAILIVILAVLFMTQRKPKTVRKEPTTPPVAAPAQQIILSPTISPVTASSEATLGIPKDAITIQILNGSGVAGQADTVRQDLLEQGFSNVTTGNAPNVQSSRALIIFKKEVGENERNEIIEVIKLFVDDYTIQEKDDIDVDVLITTSRRTATPTP